MTLGPTIRKTKYLNNRDLLAEIHRSKCSFSSFSKPEYSTYDLILPSVDKINVRTIAAAKRKRAAVIAAANRKRAAMLAAAKRKKAAWDQRYLYKIIA